MKKIILFAIMMVYLATGCARTAELQSNMDYRTDELTYEYMSKQLVEKKESSLSIGSFVVEDVLPPDATVVKTSSILVPLLFLNIWRYKYQANLGHDRIVNDYKAFMKESFVQEVKQGSLFSYAENQGDFSVEVTINKVEISAPIKQSGGINFLPLAFGWNENFSFGPLDVAVHSDVIVKYDGVVVSNRKVQGKYKTDIDVKNPVWERIDFGVLMQDYTSVMIDSLSLAIRDLNQNIVTMINHDVGVLLPQPLSRQR